MAQTVGIRFTLAGGDTDFYDDEVMRIELMPLQDFSIQENQVAAPVIKYEGSTWITVKIDFLEKYATTKAKIDALINEEKEMTLYYAYKYDDSLSYAVILYPDNIKKVYRFGELGANIVHTLTFLQSA